jgi:hypothetical protein
VVYFVHNQVYTVNPVVRQAPHLSSSGRKGGTAVNAFSGVVPARAQLAIERELINKHKRNAFGLLSWLLVVRSPRPFRLMWTIC